MPAPEVTQELGYNAFISYSHAADGRLAPAVQRGLQRFAKPWYRTRALTIFRDNESLSATPQLWTSIQEALDTSEFYILLASPAAAGSRWVAKEAERWRTTKPMDCFLIGLTEGDILWSETAGDFDWERTTALPAVLQGAFREEPRIVDLRWAREAIDVDLRDTRFRDSIADLAAPLHHKPKAELASAEVREHRRTIRIAWTAVAVLAAVTAVAVLAAVFALISRNTTIAQRNDAQSEQLATESLAASTESQTNDPSERLSDLLALAAATIAPTDSARQALTFAITKHLPASISLGSSLQNVVSTRDGNAIATVTAAVGPDAGVRVWGTKNHTMTSGSGYLSPGVGESAIALSPDAKWLALGGDLIRLAGGQAVADRQLMEGGPVSSGLSFDRSAKTLLVTASQKVALWNVTSGTYAGSICRADSLDGPVSVSADPLANVAACGFDDGRVRFENIATGREVSPPIRVSSGPIYSVAYSPNGRYLATIDATGQVALWIRSGRSYTEDILPTPVQWAISEGEAVFLTFSPDSQFVAAEDGNDDVALWSTTTHHIVGLFATFTSSGLAFGPGDAFLAFGKYEIDTQPTGLVLVRPRYWTSPISALSSQLCRQVRSNLTTTQWRQYVDGRPYQKVCPSYP
jgi:WD40 repeat protein